METKILILVTKQNVCNFRNYFKTQNQVLLLLILNNSYLLLEFESLGQYLKVLEIVLDFHLLKGKIISNRRDLLLILFLPQF